MTAQVKANEFQWGTRGPQDDLAGPSRALRCCGMLLGLALGMLPLGPASASENQSFVVAPAVSEALPVLPLPAASHRPSRANFLQEVASPEAQELAHWVVNSSDNRKLPFVIIDKVQAKVFVFDAQGLLRGASAALLGLAVGDDSVAGIGQRKLSTIRPEERTTPAGRFVASLDRDVHGEEVLWVDYDTSVSLHRVVPGQPKDRRAQRLASPSPLDNRITYGCINVPVRFYEDVVSPAFQGTEGVVYVLPETRPARTVFGSYPIQEHAGLQRLTPLPLAEPAPR